MTRIFIALFVLAAVSSPAFSAETYRLPCWAVKLALEAYKGDREAVRQAAKDRGYSEADIAEAARRCLK